MRLGILFSGGKDSVYSCYLAKKYNHDVCCLISLISKNKNSYMFHTPNISYTKTQADLMGIPLILKKTKGNKEKELDDLFEILKKAKKNYNLDGIVTGAVYSVYQASRIQKICSELNLEVFNPLWQMNEEDLLKELFDNDFEIIISGIFAYPLTKEYLGLKLDKDLIDKLKLFKEKYKISLIGEGGEFETFVLDCPLFKKRLILKSFDCSCETENSCYMNAFLESVKK